MERSLHDPKDVADKVRSQPSDFSKLTDEQLASEVQKFNGYNHFSRSGSILLEEVVARLMREPQRSVAEGTRNLMGHQHRSVALDVTLDFANLDEVKKAVGEDYTQIFGVVVGVGLAEAVKSSDWERGVFRHYTWREVQEALVGSMRAMDVADLVRSGVVVQLKLMNGGYPNTLNACWTIPFKGQPQTRSMGFHVRGGNAWQPGSTTSAIPGSVYTEADLGRAKVKVVVATRGKYSNHFHERLMTQLKAAGLGNPQAFYERLTKKYQVANWYKQGERETNNVAIYLMADDELFWRWEPIEQEQQQ